MRETALADIARVHILQQPEKLHVADYRKGEGCFMPSAATG